MAPPAFLPSTFPPPARPALSHHVSRPRRRPPTCSTGRLSGKTILVTGATGPTGRLICGALHSRGAAVRALIRPRTYMYDRRRVDAIRELCPSVRFVMGDLRDTPSLVSAVHGVHGVVSASGTRNFEGTDPNRPEVVDWKGVARLAEVFLEAQLEQDLVLLLSDGDAGTSEVGEEGGEGARGAGEVAVYVVGGGGGVCDASRFVLVSSLGVTRPGRFPQLQQMGGLLGYKLCGEEAVRESGVPFTIVRPGGFVDGPAGEARVVVDQGDRVAGSISRADVADICAEAIFCRAATNITFECIAQTGFGSPSAPVSAAKFRGLQPDEM